MRWEFLSQSSSLSSERSINKSARMKMKISKSMKSIFLLLVSLSQIACVSQVNRARETVNNLCADLGQPIQAQAYERDLLEYKGKSYVLVERYLWSQTHAKDLTACIGALSCNLRWSDWQNECNKQRSFFRELILGRSSCDIEKPNC